MSTAQSPRTEAFTPDLTSREGPGLTISKVSRLTDGADCLDCFAHKNVVLVIWSNTYAGGLNKCATIVHFRAI